MNVFHTNWVDHMLSLAVEHEVESPDHGVRVGSVWISKSSRRKRIVVDVRGDEAITRFDGGYDYHYIKLETLKRLYQNMDTL